MAIKDSLGGISWIEWSKELRDREEQALKCARLELAEEIRFYRFQQYEFDKQWKKLHRYANENRPEDGTCLLYERPGCMLLLWRTIRYLPLFLSPLRAVIRSSGSAVSMTAGPGLIWMGSLPTPPPRHPFWCGGEGERTAVLECRTALQGIEFAVFPDFVRYLKTIDPHASVLDSLSKNRTYHALPPEIVTVLHRLFKVAQNAASPRLCWKAACCSVWTF